MEQFVQHKKNGCGIFDSVTALKEYFSNPLNTEAFSKRGLSTSVCFMFTFMFWLGWLLLDVYHDIGVESFRFVGFCL